MGSGMAVRFAPLDAIKLARLIVECARTMNAEDERRIDADEQHWRPVAGEPSVKGREICDVVARAKGCESFGEVVYLLLCSTWNDALDWASRHGANWEDAKS